MSLEIGDGERLAIVGENGAGKSSLMNVVYGLYRPDAGELRVFGKPVALKSPKDAIALGIGMVHQHFMLVPTLTVAENMVLGSEPRRGALLDLDRAKKDAEAIATRFGFKIDPDAKIDDLTVGSRQKVEILKALHRGAKVLILDEPTAVLTPQEADELFAVTKRLKDDGHTVVLISHKLKEVLAFADRIAVMRRGKLVATVRASETDATQLAELMVGKNLPPAHQVTQAKPGGELLRLTSISANGANDLAALRDVSLHVNAGEIVGIAGVDGNGQRELAEVVTGLRVPTGGAVGIAGKNVETPTPATMRKLHVRHIPEDRHRFAIVGPMTVEENLSLGQHREPPYARGALIDFAARRKRADELVKAFDVRPEDPTVPIQALSGGNQQKVVVARETSHGVPSEGGLLVAVQPTRGLDISAVAQVRERLLEHAARGGAVLLISLDLEEVMALSHRLYVLFEGQVRGEFARSEFDERRIGHVMLGAEAQRAG